MYKFHLKKFFNAAYEITLVFLQFLSISLHFFQLEFIPQKQIIQPPGAIASNLILEDYINIFKNYSEKCFPLPPESSYKYVEAKMKFKNEKRAFTDRWIGNKSFSKGERDNIEMKLCFGNEKEPDFFLRNSNFDKLSFRLYGPLINALKK